MPQRLQHDLSDLGAELVGPDDHVRVFLDDFLLAFEKVLLGRHDGIVPDHYTHRHPTQPEYVGLEEEVANLHRFFDPNETREDFLDWLARWAALSLRAGLSSERRRTLVARIIPLYRIRGTKKYVEELLRLHLDAAPSVDDTELPKLQVGAHSTVGKDTYVGGGPPHFFRVTLAFETKDPVQVNMQAQIARSVVDLAKPAHTFYELDVVSPAMQVGVHSTVGFDSILGS
jgi:phage tail-like protein